MSASSNKRVRKLPHQRRQEILDAAVQLIAERGYNGISLRDIAQAVNMTQQGVLHYVGNKAGIAALVMTEFYDPTSTPHDFLRSGLPGSNPDEPHFPAYLRYLVRENAKRRDLVQMFALLQAESIAPDHPAHDYFEHRPTLIWQVLSQYPWKLPPQIGGWENMENLHRMALEAMDGIQLRWLRSTPIDLYDEWLAFEHLLFPTPLWTNYL